MEVGFLGLAIMVKAMSMNLLKNGFEVTVWNRTLSKVVFDKDGVLERIGGGKGYIDMSTVDPETSTKISAAIISKGASFLEAPVSGSEQPAETGQLVILAAGDKALYEEVIPAFDVLGKKSFFLGQIGNGAKMKLVVNMIMGSVVRSKRRIKVVTATCSPFWEETTALFVDGCYHFWMSLDMRFFDKRWRELQLRSVVNAFSERLVLAERSGLNPSNLLDVLDLGATAIPMFRVKGPAMPKSSYSCQFVISFKEAKSMGLGDLDFSAVYEILKASKE
ncbi:hypothetical protein Tsubulata_022272 [Turnera subulata]|uniref:6-phosphogluconate dehydrogenase NADP-binding domain-containing protein n=1 Tax=Turnera subulata TaxID=218843 RepID=A0A9Q0GGE1_9ROSI|nr:hypothetical protein Tsubulata_022272 [Turnera subulata]